MSLHRRQIGGLQDDIWRQNEKAFRRLYLNERKTLKNVKKVMENEYNFPTTPLSTYESKLRDLGLRKKMKKKDWHPIYQHYVNSGHRHTTIYFNGTRIPWDKAWKEIRRSGARECNDALYRLANDDVSGIRTGMPLDEALEVIINQTPKNILLKLLESDSLTVRVAVDKLAEAFSKLNRKDDFFSLVDVIRRLHPNWMKHALYLELSANLGCVNSCQLLLQMRRQAKRRTKDYYNWEHSYVAAVLNSIAKGHVECAKILAGHVFKPSAALLKPEKFQQSEILWRFLYAVAEGSCGLNVPFELQTPAVSEMLEWFLVEAGANIDMSARPAGCPRFVKFQPGVSKQPYYTMYTPRKWMPTGLDYIYFKNSELYAHLAEHSTRFKTEVTRSGAHHSASQGIESLRTYLLRRGSYTPAEQDAFLESLLIEEFLRIEVKEHPDFNVINTLLEYNLGLQKFRLKLHESVMLYYAIKAANRQYMHPALGTKITCPPTAHYVTAHCTYF
ncbi:hypothetical protein CIB48_g11581 [Xylaria polymorpha]|nr:hypothetical protein CIB48_g11581 [Xylaria polymorpha]